MNDQLQQALAVMLNKTVGAIGAGVDFLSAELPEVIRQLLIWKAVESGLVFGFCLILTVICIITWKKMWRATVDTEIPFIAVNIVVGGLCFTSAVTHLQWLQIWLAPKVYLIEFAASVVKH